MSELGDRKEPTNHKVLGTIEVNGQLRAFYIPATGTPNLYVEGINEPIIRAAIDFEPDKGWEATELIEDPAQEDLIAQITVSGQYKNYVEEVATYIEYLNKTKPNGI